MEHKLVQRSTCVGNYPHPRINRFRTIRQFGTKNAFDVQPNMALKGAFDWTLADAKSGKMCVFQLINGIRLFDRRDHSRQA